MLIKYQERNRRPGKPHSNVSVTVKGTTIGATTDNAGNFMPQVDKGRGKSQSNFVACERRRATSIDRSATIGFRCIMDK